VAKAGRGAGVGGAIARAAGDLNSRAERPLGEPGGELLLRRVGVLGGRPSAV